MRYLIIDGEIGGTGIKDELGDGYVDARKLGLPPAVTSRLNVWLLRYADEHYDGFVDNESVQQLDKEGVRLAREIKSALGDCKISYFSSATLTRTLID